MGKDPGRGGGESISKEGAQSQGAREMPRCLEELLNILNISTSEIEARHPRSSWDFNFLKASAGSQSLQHLHISLFFQMGKLLLIQNNSKSGCDCSYRLRLMVNFL